MSSSPAGRSLRSRTKSLTEQSRDAALVRKIKKWYPNFNENYDGDDLFDRLSPEIRNHIYDFALTLAYPPNEKKPEISCIPDAEDFGNFEHIALYVLNKQINREIREMIWPRVTWVHELNLKLPNGGEQDFVRKIHKFSTPRRDNISSIKVVATNTKAISLYSLTNLAQMFGDDFCFRRPERIQKQKDWLVAEQAKKAAEQAKAAESGQAVPAETSDTIDQEIELAMNMPDFGLTIEYEAPGPSRVYAAYNLDELLKGVQLRGEKFARDGVTHGRVIAKELFLWINDVVKEDAWTMGRSYVRRSVWMARFGGRLPSDYNEEDFEKLWKM